MAYNCDIDFKYYYPVTYQIPNTYATQCDPQSYNYSYYINAYQNQLRNLKNREITMEYWTRQLEYFRNLLKNFSAEIETPEDLKNLLETCNFDVNSKKCFEKRRTFFNINKNFGPCCCNSCLENALVQLCNALSVPWPCNRCNCSACQSNYQKPCCAKYSYANNCQTSPGYCYIPSQAPGYSYYYYYPYQTPASPSYCQTMPQQFTTSNNGDNFCPPNCEMCCNKCKFKNILNQINYILSSAEQLKNVPCACNMPCPPKSCCSIKEIKEETIQIKRESVVENDPNKALKKSIDNTTNANKKTTPRMTETENILCSPENCYEQMNEYREVAPGRVSLEAKRNSIRKSRNYVTESTTKYHSEAETIDDASNLSEEYRNYDTCVKKQASIVLGEAYVSPSGTFEVLIDDERNNCCCKQKKKHCKNNRKNNGSLAFHVDYTTYTKPKCDVGN